MLSNIGIPGLILIVLVALIAFGPKKIPELGKSMGRGLREFKSATSGMLGNDEDEAKAGIHEVSAKSEAKVEQSAATVTNEKQKIEADKVSM